MGSHSRLTEALMEKFLLTEEDASERAHLIERAGVGDDLSDALSAFEEEGTSVPDALKKVKEVRDLLNDAIEALEESAWPLRRPRSVQPEDPSARLHPGGVSRGNISHTA